MSSYIYPNDGDVQLVEVGTAPDVPAVTMRIFDEVGGEEGMPLVTAQLTLAETRALISDLQDAIEWAERKP